MTQRAIFKYPLELSKLSRLKAPRGARLRHVGEQHGGLFVWLEVDPDAPPVVYTFRIFCTGEPLAIDTDRPARTVQMASGLVWHVFAPRGML